MADKDHLHHRLMRLGHGQRRSVLILWTWTVLLSAIVLYPTYRSGSGDLYVPMAVAAAALVLFTLVRPRRPRAEQPDADVDPDGREARPPASKTASRTLLTSAAAG